ncbi:two-component system histidine kinase PnpS [Desulforamulus aquiferis]|uniref:histidine kinase n=1 Tax=Desulforamulus aquiferis TaxID=1397668 RepID=A0AAW7ZEZ2_9FIRM|nr:ATP-binding protein [Desulforamulus aquiferis]MDO7787968.1 ATP-binding protein [Desulforamulus aquiferis]
MLKGIRQRTIGNYGLLLAIFVGFFLLHYQGYVSLWVVLIGSSLATGIAAWLTAQRLIAPVEQITQIAQDMAGGILDNEIRVEGEGELDDLAWSINFMARELKENLANITEERNRARAILNSMADGVIALDKYGRVILLNPVVENIFKVKEKECIGNILIKVIRNYELEQLFNRALYSLQPTLVNDLQVLTPEPRLLRIHITPLKGANGRKMGVVCLMRDVTEQKRLEQIRTEFVANVSHELRTPLTSINGFLETLLDGAIDNPKVARNFLEIMNGESKRLSRLIDDLLKLSSLEDKKSSLNKQPVNLKELICETVKMLSARAQEKGIALTMAIPDDLPEVPGERGFLEQVLINLLDNAVKYTLSGGIIEIGALVNGKEIKVYVADTGIGIPEESLPRVFERFYRVDKARSRDMGGTGLGLAISKHIVEAHGGKIEVESDQEGSTFSFILPR